MYSMSSARSCIRHLGCPLKYRRSCILPTQDMNRACRASHCRVEEMSMKLRVSKHRIRQNHNPVLHTLECLHTGIAYMITGLPRRPQVESLIGQPCCRARVRLTEREYRDLGVSVAGRSQL